MNSPSSSELASWVDPEELLEALYRVSREPTPGLRDALFALLEHSDAEVREEALRILVTRWKDHEARAFAITALASDPAPSVRSAAAFAIGASTTDVTRTPDTRRLISVLRHEGEDLEVRAAAYDALLILHRKPAEGGRWPFPSTKTDFDPEQDVDWDWVFSLSRGGD
jgi:HEAT repeat protein